MSGRVAGGGGAGVDRAAVALGAVSLLSVGLAQAHGRYAVIELRPWSLSLAAAIGLGLVAIVAGLTRRRLAAAATGAVFVAAAVVQVPVWGSGNNWLGGNGATASLWLGLGLGLMAVGLADRLWADRWATES
ncbi:hypothetical protein EDC02_5154 [Micromonospora sp. Llam0]|uniref:Rv1678 family membrane protein n=1 Tax=Micromonospora sp. Llam0 TaxID=2485143 RepID=UPI000F4A6030|nr:hypothetical protein [Micromonospora sp. Llam0]ROO63137.1 hypothetical protein EDC02_5154 [Micromonospora sp. Llam0]